MDLIILNKNAKSGNSNEVLDGLVKIYNELKIDYEVVFGEDDKDATRKARMYSLMNNVDNIVSVGGDGTLNAIVNGMIGSNKGLIVVPAGSGNDYYRGIMKYNDDFYTDLGKCNDEYFLGTLSIGFDAETAHLANELKKQNYNGNPYVKAALKVLKTIEPISLECKGDFNYTGTVYMNCFSNNNYYGKGINISPNSKLDDHLLKMCFINKVPKSLFMMMFIKILTGHHYGDKRVLIKNINNLNIKFDKETLYSYDGEDRYGKEINLSIEPSKVLIKRNLDKKIIDYCNSFIK